MNDKKFTINKREDGFSIGFNAMASPCEVIIETQNERQALLIADIVMNEVWRIEDKYSRYKPDSLCSKINQSAGEKVTIDLETHLLLNFADQCYQISDGLFDITSGVLRRIWRFDGSENIATQEQIDQLLPYIGWPKIHYSQQTITVPEHMELDFGGIGKEYAVDRALVLIKDTYKEPVLVNLGGDLAVTGPRNNKLPWQVGVEKTANNNRKTNVILLYQGALATSGDSKRYLFANNKRYSHILNAKTGWPIVNAPSSITVNADICIQAGMLATLASLQGNKAQQFLDEQDVRYWLEQ